MDSIAQERLAHPRPSRRKLPDDAVWMRELDEGMSVTDVAQRYGVTRDAVYKRLRALKEEGRKPGRLPWVVSGTHREGSSRILVSLYAYAKHASGEAVTKEELQMANRLRDLAATLGTLIYNPVDGFQWRDRRPDDTDIMMPE